MENGQDSHRWGEMRATGGGSGDSLNKAEGGKHGSKGRTSFWLSNRVTKKCGWVGLKYGIHQY